MAVLRKRGMHYGTFEDGFDTLLLDRSVEIHEAPGKCFVRCKVNKVANGVGPLGFALLQKVKEDTPQIDIAVLNFISKGFRRGLIQQRDAVIGLFMSFWISLQF